MSNALAFCPCLIISARKRKHLVQCKREEVQDDKFEFCLLETDQNHQHLW